MTKNITTVKILDSNYKIACPAEEAEDVVARTAGRGHLREDPGRALHPGVHQNDGLHRQSLHQDNRRP